MFGLVAHRLRSARLGPLAASLLGAIALAACSTGTDVDGAEPDVGQEPDAEPTPTEPDAPEPDAPEPDAPAPDVTPEPEAAEPDVTLEPDAPEPDVTPEPEAPEPDATPEPEAPEPDVTPEPDPPLGVGPTCFADIFDPDVAGPNYDQFAPTVGGHCMGTQHQSITGVERVVFLGDSVTVGTPPTESADFYRSRVAEALAERFDLEAPSVFWRLADPLNGTAGTVTSGDFASCAKWGARTDDLLEDGSQVVDCFPAEERDKKTLVIMTMGGNDLAAITKMGPEGVPLDEIWAETEAFVARLREAVAWMTDPANVPGGVYVVFANLFEFTDGTGDVGSCASAGLAGFDEPWANPADLEAMVLYATEQYMDIAVSSATDMIFLLEHFCGHGFRADDETGRCYRGPDTERWFDLTCIHPNPTGHEVIADMFLAVVDG